MKKEYLMRIRAAEIKQELKNKIITEYERNDIPGLNGFKLTWEELSRDTELLEEEILEIMRHPKKYKKLNTLFAYIINAKALREV